MIYRMIKQHGKAATTSSSTASQGPASAFLPRHGSHTSRDASEAPETNINFHHRVQALRPPGAQMHEHGLANINAAASEYAFCDAASPSGAAHAPYNNHLQRSGSERPLSRFTGAQQLALQRQGSNEALPASPASKVYMMLPLDTVRAVSIALASLPRQEALPYRNAGTTCLLSIPRALC